MCLQPSCSGPKPAFSVDRGPYCLDHIGSEAVGLHLPCFRRQPVVDLRAAPIPTEALAAGLGSLESSRCPLRDQAALQFGHGRKLLEHEPTRGPCGKFWQLGEADIHALVQYLQEQRHIASQPVDLRDHQGQTTAPRLGDGIAQFGAVGIAAALDLDELHDGREVIPQERLDLAVKNARDTDQKLSVGGVNAYMNTIRGFLVWCMKRKHIQHVPDFTNTQLHDVRSEHARRLPFKPADLKAIFGSSMYAETVGSSSWKYWGPLLGLYHGLRLGEVCQLNPEDISQTGDVWCVNITASVQRGIPDKKLKTQHSDRLLPMHPVLVRLGLPEFAASRPETEKLFPDVAIGRDGHYSSVASKAFRRMLDDCGLKGSKETFHSFRHNFTSAMEDAGLSSSTQDWLGGWAGTTKSERKRYRSRPGVADLKPSMERVTYPELDPVIEGFKAWAP